MKLLKFSSLLLLATVPWSSAIETDQFAAWTHELKDSAPQLEAYLRRSITKSLGRLNKYGQVPRECSFAIQYISDNLSKMSAAPFVTSVESWLMTSKKVDAHSIGRTPWESVQDSIYKGYWRFKVLPFASTVNLYGVHLGVDKVGHFAEFGMTYYNKLQSYLREGRSYAEATNLAVDHGAFLEDTLFGTLAARIFSYGDMEANFQGMKWYESLCTAGDHAHLSFQRGKWKLKNAEKLSLKKHVSPLWDESYYLNYFEPDIWKRVESSLVYKCLELEDPVIAARFTRYQNVPVTEHARHLENLEGQGKTPKRKFKYLADYCFE